MSVKNIAVLDTNIIIRFLTRDNEELYSKAKEILSSIESGNVKAKLTESVFAEIVFVLDKVYNVERKKIAALVGTIVCMHGLDQANTLLYKQALDYYANSKIDIVDCLLLAYQKINDYHILPVRVNRSFEENFSKRIV